MGSSSVGAVLGLREFTSLGKTEKESQRKANLQSHTSKVFYLLHDFEYEVRKGGHLQEGAGNP